MSIGKRIKNGWVGKDSLPACTDDQNLRRIFKNPFEIGNRQLTEPVRTPWGCQFTVMKAQPCGIPAFTDQEGIVIVAAKEQRSFGGVRGNVRGEGAAANQGFASSSSISSSFSPKRPSSESMTGLAM